MEKLNGKTKNVGGSKGISECRTKKSEEPTMEVFVVIDGKKSQISLSEFRTLLFQDVKKVEKPMQVTGVQKLLNSFYDLTDTPENKKHRDLYGQKMLIEFTDYWTEMLPSGKKQRWQKEKAFDVSRRLKTWAKRDYSGHWKKHKEDMINKEQAEYYRKAEKDSESFMMPEEQRREINKILGRVGRKV